MVLVHNNLFLLTFSAFGAKPKPKTASAGQQNQDYHGNTNRWVATATAIILTIDRDAVDTLEADLETKLGLGGSILQHTLRRGVNNYRNFIVVIRLLLGGHKGFDVVAGDKAADRDSTKTTSNRSSRGSGARHEGGLSKSEDGDTVDTEVARVNVGEELWLKLGLDITDTTLATDLLGQGVGDGVGDGLGVGSATVGMRNDESENVLYKDILSNDTVIDPDAHLKERSLCEGCRISDLAVVIQADVGLYGVGEVGVGGLAIGRSAVGADLSESEVGREVNGNGDIGLVKVDGLDEAVAVDVVVVHAEVEPDDGGCTVDVLVVYGVWDGFLDDVKLDIELVSAGGIKKARDASAAVTQSFL
jgi:hypothetical protein